MIINTGCRTDIPAFYAKWLINRIREGFVLVRNPYYPSQVTKYSLSPDIVDCLAFCTKNPKPMIKYLKELDKYNKYWFVTITPYGKDIEPNVPEKEEVIESFKELSKKIGANSIGLRYDPIFINMDFDVSKHIQEFEKIVKSLKGYTHDCTISFLDLYEKVKKNARNIKPPTNEEEIVLAKAFYQIGKQNDMIIHSCCEKTYLSKYGIDISGCMSQDIIEKSIHNSLNPLKTKKLREGCNCLMGNDIGSYNSCGHLCKYCYANYNEELVKQNMKKHNENSPFLIGDYEKEDKIHLAKQNSWIKNQNEQLTFYN